MHTILHLVSCTAYKFIRSTIEFSRSDEFPGLLDLELNWSLYLECSPLLQIFGEKIRQWRVWIMHDIVHFVCTITPSGVIKSIIEVIRSDEFPFRWIIKTNRLSNIECSPLLQIFGDKFWPWHVCLIHDTVLFVSCTSSRIIRSIIEFIRSDLS